MRILYQFSDSNSCEIVSSSLFLDRPSLSIFLFDSASISVDLLRSGVVLLEFSRVITFGLGN